MTVNFTIPFFLSGIFTLLLIITKHITTDKEIKELLKQIRDNTRDKTIPVKPVNVSVEKTRVTKFAECPVCDRLISNSSKHCENCGAEIDWSDTK